MTATEDHHEIELEHFAHKSYVVEAALASIPDIVTADEDPTSLAEVRTRSDWLEWKKAMDEELALMAKYDVWDEVDKPEDTNIVGCRWIFCIKRDASGKILKYRARLVAQGLPNSTVSIFTKPSHPSPACRPSARL